MKYEYHFVRCFERERDETIERWAEAGWRLIQVVEATSPLLLLFEREAKNAD